MPTPPIPIGPATQLVTYAGKPVDVVMRQFLQRAQIALGFALTVIQGYNPGNMATSAGTHSYGVVDLAPLRAAEKLHVWGQLGGFMWHREAIDGLWQEHLHGGIRNHPGLAEVAVAQQRDWDGVTSTGKYGGPPRSGLLGHVVDNDVLAYRPAKPVQFVYDPKWSPNMPKPTKIQEARDRITDAAVALGDSIVALHDADESRVVARSTRPELRVHKKALEALLDRIPKK